MIFGAPHGKGSYSWTDRKYEVQWIGGAPWGRGKLNFLKTGEQLEGDFEGGQLVLGRILYSNGVVLEGKFTHTGLEWGRRINIDKSLDEGDFIKHDLIKTEKSGARYSMSLTNPPTKFVDDWTVVDTVAWAKRTASGFEFLFQTSNIDGKKLLSLSGNHLDFFKDVAKIYQVENSVVKQQEQGQKELEKINSIKEAIEDMLNKVGLNEEKNEQPIGIH